MCGNNVGSEPCVVNLLSGADDQILHHHTRDMFPCQEGDDILYLCGDKHGERGMVLFRADGFGAENPVLTAGLLYNCAFPTDKL